MREPSRGGMGIRLKTPNTRFMTIKFTIIKLKTKGKGIIFNKIDNTNARIRFDKGPLAPTQIISLFGFFNAQ